MHMQYKVDPDDALALPSFRELYLLTGVVAALVAADLVLAWLGYDALRNPLGVNLSLAAAVLGGARIVYGALTALLEGQWGADLALAVALVAALVLGEYWVGAEVVLIALVGESLEALTFARTHREIHRILELRPRRVRVRRGEQIVEIAVGQVAAGDVVVLRPGDRVPVDGTVLTGRSAVDQSTLTGESIPVDKGPGDEIFAGTLNQFGALEVRTDVVGDATTLGQVIRLVADAQHHKGAIERTADRLARYFLPFVLICAAITFVATNSAHLWAAPAAGAQARWVWMPTLAVLVVSCPCALILATPAALLAALAWLARRGVLIKGGIALERLAGVSRLAFDKTGTLTEGKLQLGDCLPLGQLTADELLRLAATAEQSSEHLLARVIVDAARSRALALDGVAEFTALPGAGVLAVVGGGMPSAAPPERLLVGNRRLLVEQGIAVGPAVDQALARLESTGQTPLLVCRGAEVVGTIGVRDTVRPEAAQVIEQLRQLGIDQIVLLTGDRPAAAAQVARAVGITRYEAELRPADKAEWLKRWRSEDAGQRGGAPLGVGMIGDGVNDAPALATADVGLALAGVGSDLAAEAGDIVLMGDPLAPLPGLVGLARQTVRVIRQNIILFAFLLNFAGIALTGWIMPTWSVEWEQRSPVAAALFHQVGSVLVLLSAMRLLWFQRWQQSWLGRLEDGLAQACHGAADRLAPAAWLAVRLWAARWALARTAAYLAFAGYVALGITVVQTDEVAVVKRCGRFAGVLQPGLYFRLPPPWDTVIKEKPARVRTIEVGLRTVPEGEPGLAGPIEWNSPHQAGLLERREDEATMLTGDQSLVELGASVQYRITDVEAFCFQVRDAPALLKAVIEGVVREVAATRPLLADGRQTGPAEILTAGRDPIEREIGRRVQARAEALGLGVEILAHGVCLQDVHPPLAVVPAFRDVSSAFKEKERMQNEADAYQRELVIKAAGLTAWRQLAAGQVELDSKSWQQLRPQLEGEVAAELLSAEAFALEQTETAAGDAAAFLLKQAAHATAPRLTEWRLLLDALGQTLPGKKKVILDGQASGRRHLLLGLPAALDPAALPAWNIPLNPEPEH